jgi:hypothetical protein
MNVIDIRRGTFVSSRSFCPNCKVERTGDSLVKPCECMAFPERMRNRQIRAAERKTREWYEKTAAMLKAMANA